MDRGWSGKTLLALVIAAAMHTDAAAQAAARTRAPRAHATQWMPDVARRMDKLRSDAARAAARELPQEKRWWSVACPPPEGR